MQQFEQSSFSIISQSSFSILDELVSLFLYNQFYQLLWDCKICNRQNHYYYYRCFSCGQPKTSLCDRMSIDVGRMEQDFKIFVTMDFEINENHGIKEIIEIDACILEMVEVTPTIRSKISSVIKPFELEAVSPECTQITSITTEQAASARTLESFVKELTDSLSLLENYVLIFLDRNKAKLFFEKTSLQKIQLPESLNFHIDLHSVFPQKWNIDLNHSLMNMSKALQLQFNARDMMLAEIVRELISRCYVFKQGMRLSGWRNEQGFSKEQLTRLQGFDFLIVIDFEATCWKDEETHPQNRKKSKRVSEIIEFPAVVYNVRTQEILSEPGEGYHTYVRPVINPILSDFCTELTGITQQMVESGITLQEALSGFCQFLETQNLLKHRICVVTCGDYDMNQLKREANEKNLAYPHYLKYYINIKKAFPEWVKPEIHRGKPPPGMIEMLDFLGLQLEGRHHSGIDDAKNIARVAQALCRKGFEFNEAMISYSMKI